VTRLIERRTHKNPRLLVFYGVVTGLMVVLSSGLAYRQLLNGSLYDERARLQNLRRVVSPGPRGNIFDREGRLLVGNRPRFSVVLDLAELRGEFRTAYKTIKRNYADSPAGERPDADQMERIARSSVAQRYLDQVNAILHRNEKIRPADLSRHVNQTLLLPYVLLDDLPPEEYARLIERLPVNSPLQVYTSSTRNYPYKTAAAHTLGYVSVSDDPQTEDLPGDDLLTFKMKSNTGRTGLEKLYEDQLQGESGGAIYQVDPAGYKVALPLEKRMPVQGKNITTSLDIDLQQAAEENMKDSDGKDRIGAAVALDVRTGEVLVLSSKPDYDLNSFVPRLSHAEADKIADDGAWFNQAIAGAYPPGSTFKILTSIAALRSGSVSPDRPITDCEGVTMVGNKRFVCENGQGHHGEIHLAEAIANSCDIYFYEAARLTTADALAAEAKRFHLDRRTGIELPGETGRMVIPDPEWKQKTQKERWFPGDTANMAIGQGYVLVTPLDMACFAASVARDEVYTKPTIIHNPQAPTQHTASIGLTPPQRAALLTGMEGCTIYGTAKFLSLPRMKIPGVRIAGKTGTAQKRVVKDGQVGTINCAWFICFAPIEHPEIAIAVMIEGENLGENFGGGAYAMPVAHAILQKYFEKKQAAGQPKPPAITLR
jgi:penicillin-binding protein 2